MELGKTVVLIADDEPSMRALVTQHLRTRGYKVVEASDGDEAIALACEHLPQVVLLDVMMPGMNGWEVSRRIRETVSLAHTGIIMLTGIGENLNEMTSPLYGADAYLDKPFEFTVLDRTITDTLTRRKNAIGRLDGADVEIIQTTDYDEDIPESRPEPAPRPKKLPETATTSGAKTQPKTQGSRRSAKEATEDALFDRLSETKKGSLKKRPVFDESDFVTPQKKAKTGKLVEKPALLDAPPLAKPAKEAPPKPAKKAPPKPAKKAPPKPAKKAPPKPAKKAPPKPAKKAPAKPAKKAPAKPAKKAPKKPAKKAPAKPAKKAPKKSKKR